MAGTADAAAEEAACTVTLCQAGRCSDADSYELHFSEVALRCDAPAAAAPGAARALLLAACQEAQRLQAALVESDRLAVERAPVAAATPQHKRVRGRSRGKRCGAAHR